MFIHVVDGSKIQLVRAKIGPTNFHCWHPSHASTTSAPRCTGPTLDHIRLLSLALITARLSCYAMFKRKTVTPAVSSFIIPLFRGMGIGGKAFET